MADSNFNTPQDVAKSLTNTICVNKTNANAFKLLILGILAGVYIGFGSSIATLVLADASKFVGIGLSKLIAGLIFCIGLILIVVGGGELFTGNTMMCMSSYQKKAPFSKVLGRWGIVYFANFIGALILVYIMYQTKLWEGKNFLTGVQALKIANAKVNLSFGVAFFRGIGCNWLVCLAVWLSIAAKDIVGKIFAIIFPITVFVALGFEHSVANMFFVPFGIFLKGTGAAAAAGLDLSNLNWLVFLKSNLLPVTLGNIVGGSFFVATSYWLVYVKGTEVCEK
jgi:formate/nitrite transporter